MNKEDKRFQFNLTLLQIMTQTALAIVMIILTVMIAKLSGMGSIHLNIIWIILIFYLAFVVYAVYYVRSKIESEKK